MWSPLFLQCTWWLITNKAMVDYELNLKGWLDEVTLFPAEPNDYGLHFNEILNGGKTNYEEDIGTGLPDLNWLDVQVDLSILDDPKSLQSFDNANPLDLACAADLFDLVDSNLDPSYLSSDISRNELNNIFNASTQIEQQASSLGVPDINQSSPYYESISEANSPAGASCSTEGFNHELSFSPGGISTYSSVDDGGYDTISEAGSPSVAATADCELNSGAVTVTVCNMDTSSDPLLDEALSIDEITSSVRRRKYVSDGKDIPKVQVSLRNVFHPYAKAAPKRSGGKNERKKVQNKEAAARYRIKKRVEEKEISSVVSGLEREQKDLQKKHDDLATEIKYLKKLMREVLQKRGVLK